MKKFILLLSLSSLVLCSGCSWVLMDTAPDEEIWSSAPVTPCDKGLAPPIADTVFAAASLAGALLAVGQDDQVASIIGGVSGTAFWSASAYSGYSNASQCEAYQQQLNQRSADNAYFRHIMAQQP